MQINLTDRRLQHYNYNYCISCGKKINNSYRWYLEADDGEGQLLSVINHNFDYSYVKICAKSLTDIDMYDSWDKIKIKWLEFKESSIDISYEEYDASFDENDDDEEF